MVAVNETGEYTGVGWSRRTSERGGEHWKKLLCHFAVVADDITIILTNLEFFLTQRSHILLSFISLMWVSSVLLLQDLPYNFSAWIFTVTSCGSLVKTLRWLYISFQFYSWYDRVNVLFLIVIRISITLRSLTPENLPPLTPCYSQRIFFLHPCWVYLEVCKVSLF